jgi:hypothetical protein
VGILEHHRHDRLGTAPLRRGQETPVPIRELGRPFETAERGRDEDERLDAVGMSEREVDRDRASIGGTDERRLPDAEAVEERAKVLRAGVGPGRVGRGAPPARVVADGAEAPGEREERPVPLPLVHPSAVQENDGAAAAALLVSDRSSL